MLILEKFKYFIFKAPPYKNHYNFTEDWFTHNIQNWKKVLKKFAGKANIRALEVGSHQGRSALWMLENILTHNTSSIVCIDSYSEPHVHAIDLFKENMKIGQFENKVSLIVDSSHNALPQLESQKFDIIYLDGHHEGEFIYKEAELCWPMLKSGGVLIFDDYLWPLTQESEVSPQIGIDRFLSKRASEFKVLHKYYQLIVLKK